MAWHAAIDKVPVTCQTLASRHGQMRPAALEHDWSVPGPWRDPPPWAHVHVWSTHTVRPARGPVSFGRTGPHTASSPLGAARTHLQPHSTENPPLSDEINLPVKVLMYMCEAYLLRVEPISLYVWLWPIPPSHSESWPLAGMIRGSYLFDLSLQSALKSKPYFITFWINKTKWPTSLWTTEPQICTVIKKE